MAFLNRKTVVSSGLAVAAMLALAGCSQGDTAAGGEDSASTAVVSSPTIIKDETLTICSGDSAPNIYYDENNELQGVEIDIAGALADELGLKTAIGEYAFAGLIPALQAKQCDVIMGSLYIKPEREEIANFVPYLYSGTAVLTNKENKQDVTGFDESLCGIKVVAINGATGASSTQELSSQCEADGLGTIDITLVDEATNGLQQVLAGQADAFVDTSEITAFYEQQSEGDLMQVGEPFGKIRIGAATLKDNKDLNEALDTAFATLVEEGTYQEILTKWAVESNDITKPE